MVEALAGALLGAVIGVLATVWATYQTIKLNAKEYQRQREHERDEDYRDRLDSLKGEIEFNINIQGYDKKIPVFVYNAWNSFLPFLYKLDKEPRKILNEAYSWALYHNNAAKLDKPNVTAYGPSIEHSYDNAVKLFKEFNRIQFGG